MTCRISLREAVTLRRLVLFVKVWINMKSYYDFVFFSTVCFSFKRFHSSGWFKIVRPKKYLEICQTPKNSRNFTKPPKTAQKFANTEKYDLVKFQTKNIRTHPCLNFDCPSPRPGAHNHLSLPYLIQYLEKQCFILWWWWWWLQGIKQQKVHATVLRRQYIVL